LDPQATGLLVILLGRGTKLSAQFMSSDKAYEGVMRLGVTTDSHDLDGQVIRELDPGPVTREQVEAQMARFRGDILQTPPMVSAVKRGGVPLYKLARRGQDVAREPKLVHIYELTLLDFRPPEVEFRVRCTKGTYVRTLCHDIGEGVGCGACLQSLRRTESGAYRASEAVPLADLLAMTQTDLLDRVIPLHAVRGERQPRSPGGEADDIGAGPPVA
jgi:tRNA pseudouridine55 synthase